MGAAELPLLVEPPILPMLLVAPFFGLLLDELGAESRARL